MNTTKSIYCGNCGKFGHTYRHCSEPITSIGIILYKIYDSKLKYLFIQRRDTLGYVEFMRGKYNLENLEYIKNTFKIMTPNERDRIINNDFDTLWNILWMNKHTKQYHNEYENSKIKFNKLKDGINIKNKTIKLKEITNETPIIYNEPEWGFPKGRRNPHESNIDCAIREFEEETGIKKINYNILNIKPINEIFLGTNNIRYKHIYYIAETTRDILPIIDLDNDIQTSEISNIKWFDYDTGFNKIRDYNIEKKKSLTEINTILKSKLKC
jgi:8-oxo-dGTP pyrophosphatase MutT (NUDIX family)